MTRTARIRVGLALLIGAPLLFAQSPQFSADYVITFTRQAAELQNRGIAPVQSGRLYLSGTKMRMDMGQEGQQTQIIVDAGPGGKGYMVIPAQKMYMVMPEGDRQQGADLAAFLKGGGDACKIATDLRSCRKTDMSAVDGRRCENYETVNRMGFKQTACIDPRLHFPLKVVTQDNTLELKKVREGPQPATLFVPPAGFSKMDFSGLGNE